MEVILLERIRRLGEMGDVVKVKNGFGRNFLIPNRKALRATDANKGAFATRKVTIEKENTKKRADAEGQAANLSGKMVSLVRQSAEDGRLYGSVSTADIAAALAQTHSVTIERRQVLLQSTIKHTGVYPVTIQLHPEVAATIHVNVARSEAEAEGESAKFLNAQDVFEKPEDVAAVIEGDVQPEAPAEDEA